MEYTLTDVIETQVMQPNFEVDPSWCSKSSTTDAPIDSDIPDDIDYDPTTNPDGPTLSVGPITDRLTPSDPNDTGVTETTVPVTTTFVTCDYDDVCTEYPVITPVTLKNPCVDQNYVTIS